MPGGAPVERCGAAETHAPHRIWRAVAMPMTCKPETMPELHPLRTWPRRHALVAKALHELEKIDHVELTQVRNVHGVSVFVLSVFHKRQPSRIPASRLSRLASSSPVGSASHSQPAYQLQKTVRELLALRYQVLELAHQSDDGTCAFCLALRSFTCVHYTASTKLRLLWPQFSTRKRLVDGFLNDLVVRCVDGLHCTPHGPHCRPFESIPVRAYRFLASPVDKKSLSI